MALGDERRDQRLALGCAVELCGHFAGAGREPAARVQESASSTPGTTRPIVVSTITKAHYRGVEGELPFQYWDKSDVVFVDLMSHSEKFATIDYSEDPPLLFLGESVEFEDLKLKNLRSFEGWS